MPAPPPRFLPRLSWLTLRISEAALGVWPFWTTWLYLTHARREGLLALTFIAGAGALWLVAIAGALALAGSALPVRLYGAAFAQTVDRRALGIAVLLAGAAFALGGALEALPAVWVPARLAFRGEIHAIAARCGAAVLLAAAFLARAAFDRELRARRCALCVLPLVAVAWSLAAIVRVSRAHLFAFELGALLALVAFAAGVRARGRAARAVRAVGATAALASLATLFVAPTVLAAGRGVPGASDLAVAAARLLDFDGDGHGSLLGGRDCDPWDPRVNPVALEVVDNGKDDNCFGGDLRAVPQPPKLAIRAGHPRRSLVLVTVDALQARMLDPGAAVSHMPELARFAAASAHFTRHYVHASFTNDSVGSIMSGQYPMNFSELGRYLGLNPTLAELLRSAGYATATVNQAAAQRSWYGYRGFAELDIALAARHTGYRASTSRETSDRAIARYDALRAAGRPFLLWVHYMDPHLEYVPHPGTPFPGEGEAARYHQEVWTTDRELGRLLRHLDASAFTREHVVVVTADHGEQVGAPGGSGHGWFISEDVLRTPLLLRAPDVPAGRFATRVRAVDLYPTLLDLTAGISAPGEGTHLGTVWRGEQTADRDVFARAQYTGWSLRAALIGRFKLVEDLRTGARSLYDLRGAGEARDLSAQRPDVVAALLDAMGRAWDRSINDVVLRRRAQAGALQRR